MNILIVGNVLKDVYLNLDTRTEQFEVDKNHTKWLDFSFDASEHHFFNRESSLGGAAVSLEVLQKIGLEASITGSDLSFKDEDSTQDATPASTHRYILIADGGVSYLSPSNFRKTTFTPPSESIDYIFIDRSAELDSATVSKIKAYLDISANTKLVVYYRNFNNPALNELISRADLIFAEPTSAPELANIDSGKLIHISDRQLSYRNIIETVSVERINILTHLSVYSIAAATVLGSFILGESVEDSLKLARLNIENSSLNSVLSLEELQDLAAAAARADSPELIAANLMLTGKGILAADESGGSIHKKFAQLEIPDTYESRRDYRNLFFTTPDLEKYVNGVILFDETARQIADNGQNYVSFLTSRRIIPGIKVDQGLRPIEASDSDIVENYTEGLTGLSDRLKEYYSMGLRFAKWRAAFEVRLGELGEVITPSRSAIDLNCRILAEYAKNCQTAGLVPIVEPEVVYDGDYSIEQCAEVTARILDTLFQKLAEFGVNLRACILKCNMILAGKQYKTSSTSAEVGAKTAKILKEHVPAELAGVVFLSGGQTVDQATNNLAEIIKNGPFPWPVTFSFARALQDPALYTWAGDNENANAAREAFLARLIANTDALQK